MVSYGSGDDPELMLERSRMPDEWRGREEPAPCGSLEAKWVPSSSVLWQHMKGKQILRLSRQWVYDSMSLYECWKLQGHRGRGSPRGNIFLPWRKFQHNDWWCWCRMQNASKSIKSFKKHQTHQEAFRHVRTSVCTIMYVCMCHFWKSLRFRYFYQSSPGLVRCCFTPERIVAELFAAFGFLLFHPR